MDESDNALSLAPIAEASGIPLQIPGAVLAGGMLAVSFPPYETPILLPVGIAILIAAIDGLTPRLALYAGFACGAVYFGATMFWLVNLFGLAAVSLIAIAAAFTALFSVLYVWIRARLPKVPAWILAAVIWTGLEYFRSEPFPLNFGWMGLGYGAIGCVPIAKAASWVGSYGVSFGIVALGGTLIRLAVTRRFLPLAGVLGLWFALWLIPDSRLGIERPLTVRLIQAPSEDEESLFRLSNVPASPQPSVRVSKPDFIVWPEYSLVRDPTRFPKVWDSIKRVAVENHCYFLFGAKDQFDTTRDTGFRNTAYVLDSKGRIVGRHVKNHTVHFISDGVRGTEARAVPTTLGRIGVAICFDMDYPDVARRLAADGAEVFLVPNDDPAEWGKIQRLQHRLMFRMRAAECGRWLARADVAGGTSVIAPNGIETDRVDTTEPTRLDARVGRIESWTIYVLGGWRFGPACLFGLLVLCVWAGLRAVRPAAPA